MTKVFEIKEPYYNFDSKATTPIVNNSDILAGIWFLSKRTS